MTGYTSGPTLAPDVPPWPRRWESDPAIDLCAHWWELVHLLADGKYRLYEDDVVRCAVCHTPRCGESDEADPCMERRHHQGLHIHLSGRFEPLGGHLRDETRGAR